MVRTTSSMTYEYEVVGEALAAFVAICQEIDKEEDE
jgi:hypothetical protein